MKKYQNTKAGQSCKTLVSLQIFLKDLSTVRVMNDGGRATSDCVSQGAVAGFFHAQRISQCLLLAENILKPTVHTSATVRLQWLHRYAQTRVLIDMDSTPH